jgi:hypothetical protein
VKLRIWPIGQRGRFEIVRGCATDCSGVSEGGGCKRAYAICFDLAVVIVSAVAPIGQLVSAGSSFVAVLLTVAALFSMGPRGLSRRASRLTHKCSNGLPNQQKGNSRPERCL